MNKLLTFIFICLASIVGPLNLNAYQSAHVIVTSYVVNHHGVVKKYVLFGLTKKGKLSTFGGLRDHGESNPKDTAAREAEEESLGILGNQKSVRGMLHKIKPVTGVDGDHICYVLPQKDYGKHLSKKFKKIRFNKDIKLPYCKKEMVDIVAVDVELLRQKVFQGEDLAFKDNSGVLRPLRVKGPIVDAVKAGHL